MQERNNVYQIASLKIRFDYQFEDYFKGNIDHYLVDSKEYDCYMRTLVVDEIKERITKPITAKNNRFIYFEDGMEHIVVRDPQQKIEMMVSYDLEYKDVTLYLRKDINNIEEKEYVFTGIMFMDYALSKGYLSLHAAGLFVNDEGILFSAPSKTGKSTHARYWLSTYPNTYIFNDDKPLISVRDGIKTYGSPWCGKTLVNRNIELPLKAIVFLKQGQENEIKTLSMKEKLIYLMRNINRPRQQKLWDENTRILNELVNIPMYLASVTNSVDSVDVVKNKIYGENDEN